MQVIVSKSLGFLSSPLYSVIMWKISQITRLPTCCFAHNESLTFAHCKNVASFSARTLCNLDIQKGVKQLGVHPLVEGAVNLLSHRLNSSCAQV